MPSGGCLLPRLASMHSQVYQSKTNDSNIDNVLMYWCLPSIRERLGMKVVKALKRSDPAVTHGALDMLCSLMQVSDIVIAHLVSPLVCSMIVQSISQVAGSELSVCLFAHFWSR